VKFVRLWLKCARQTGWCLNSSESKVCGRWRTQYELCANFSF